FADLDEPRRHGESGNGLSGVERERGKVPGVSAIEFVRHTTVMHSPEFADLKRHYFAADFFSSTRMTSIGPVPTYSGRCAPAGVKTASPFLPDISSVLPSG